MGNCGVDWMVEGDRRTVVEVRCDLHRELRKLALLNDLRIYVLANAIIEEALRDEEYIKGLIKRLKLLRGSGGCAPKL